MPIYEGTSGPSAALDFLAQFIAGRSAQQQQNQQNALQQKEVNARIAAQNAAQRAEQERLTLEKQRGDLEKQQFGLQQRQSGIDPNTGKAFNFGIGPKQQSTLSNPKASPQQRAAIYQAAANAALQNGDRTAAATYSAMAKDAQAEAARAQDDALKFMQFAEKRLQDAAARSHMQTQDQLSAQRNSIAMARLQVEAQDAAARIAQGNARLGDEQTRLLVEMKNLGLHTQEVKMRGESLKLQQANTQSEIGSRFTTRLQSALSRIHSDYQVTPPSGTVTVNGHQFDASQILTDFAKADSAKRLKFLNTPGLPDDLKSFLSALNSYMPAEK